MDKGSGNTQNWNGAPTAILYLGMFTCAGCLGLFLFALFTGGFFWSWMRLCDGAGLTAAIPSRSWRVLLGVLLYGGIVGVIWLRLRQNGGRTQAQAAEATAKAEAEAAAKITTQVTVARETEAEALPMTNTQIREANPSTAALRFDGVYFDFDSELPSGVPVPDTSHLWLRFYADGGVLCVSGAFMPEAAFALLDRGHEPTRLGPPQSGAYTLSHHLLNVHLGTSPNRTDYWGEIHGLELLLYFSLDPHGDSPIERPFRFVPVS